MNLYTLNLLLADLEFTMTAYAAHRIRKFAVPANLIEEVDSMPPAQPPCPKGKLRLHVTSNRPASGAPLTRMPPVAGPRPATVAPGNEGGVASPLQPRLGSPAPSVLSTGTPVTAGASRPVQLHVVNQSGSVHTVSVPNVQANSEVIDKSLANSISTPQTTVDGVQGDF